MAESATRVGAEVIVQLVQTVQVVLAQIFWTRSVVVPPSFRRRPESRLGGGVADRFGL